LKNGTGSSKRRRSVATNQSSPVQELSDQVQDEEKQRPGEWRACSPLPRARGYSALNWLLGQRQRSV